MLKVISFDVDGTLVDSSFADKVWLEGVPALYAEQHTIDFETAKTIVKKAYDCVGEDDIRWYQLDYWFNRFELQGVPHNLLYQYRNFVCVYEEVPHILEHFKEYTLVIASNAHKDFLSFTLSGIEQYFDYIFSATSDFKRVGKDKEFYQDICQILEVDPTEMAHVGDHYTFDYIIPLKIGINAFFLDREGDKGIRTLTEFEKIVENLDKD
ncbi:MAG: HAD family hydrolase [Candidatus Methanofastidiosia archaeon]|jgi:putative hydrolase of the HAD superfamily